MIGEDVQLTTRFIREWRKKEFKIMKEFDWRDERFKSGIMREREIQNSFNVVRAFDFQVNGECEKLKNEAKIKYQK
jgi:hypothetical protein